MALSGIINGSVTQKSDYFSFYITWSATQSVSDNYSDVTVKTYWQTNNIYKDFDTVGSRNASITINGTTTSISKVFAVYWSQVGNPYLIQTATQRVYHNNDGSKSITISARANGHASSYGPSSSVASSADCTASGTITLDTIPRASSFGTISGNTIGSNMTVNINRNSSSFTHQLWYKLGNSSWYNLGTGIGTQKVFTISNDLLSQLPSSTSGTLQLCLRTYNGGTQIGSDVYKNITVYVSDSVKPSVGTITLTPATINSKNILVQNKNKITVSVSGCSAGTGSSIKSYKFEGPGISITTTNMSVSGGPISNTGTLTYKVTVTDNRGRTASKSATITCYAYSTPSFTSFKAYRANSDGSANLNGTYLRYEYAINYSSVNSTNAVSVKVYGAGNTVTHSTSSGNGIINLGNNTTTYNMYAIVTDSYDGSKQSSTVTVFGSTRIMNITKDGTGFAIGKMADSNNLFECRWNARFDGTASGPSGFSTSSDARVKKNIQDINIDIIDSLHPVSYELLQSSDDKTHYGFIAQDVNEILSDAGLRPETIGLIGQIFNNGRQEYVLTYTEFIPLLTKKCQDLQAEINILKKEISALKNTSQQ